MLPKRTHHRRPPDREQHEESESEDDERQPNGREQAGHQHRERRADTQTPPRSSALGGACADEAPERVDPSS